MSIISAELASLKTFLTLLFWANYYFLNITYHNAHFIKKLTVIQCIFKLDFGKVL